MSSPEAIKARQFHLTEGAEDWRILGDGMCAYFGTGSLATAIRLVTAISELPGFGDRRPDLDLRSDGVTVRLFMTPDIGVNDGDIELVKQISARARDLGVKADPSAIQNVQIAIDALHHPDVSPFWRALLGYVDRDGPADIADPHGRSPAICFQEMDAPRPQRSRIHIDVYVPHDQAETRVAHALAAGGHLVTGEYAPAWWVLADAEGNEACVATFGWTGPVPESGWVR